jgi:hypothetical protein
VIVFSGCTCENRECACDRPDDLHGELLLFDEQGQELFDALCARMI